MNLTDLMAELEERARVADATESVAPVAKVYRLIISELGRMDGLETAGRWLDTAEAADVLGVSPKTIRKWCAAGRFPSVRKTSADGEWRIPAIEVYADAGRETGRNGTTVPKLWRAEDA